MSLMYFFCWIASYLLTTSFSFWINFFHVYLCHRNTKLDTRLPDNIIQKTSGFQRFTKSSIILTNGEDLPIDTAIYCTGYKYNFPFIPEGLLEVGSNNLVSNLYKFTIPAPYIYIYE